MLGVLFLLLIFVFAVYVPFYKQLHRWGVDKYGKITDPPVIPSFVKRYPAINYLFYLPDTEKGLDKELVSCGVFRTGTESESLDKANSWIEHVKKQCPDLDDVKFEFVVAYSSDTWKCEIDNDTETNTPLVGTSQIWLEYFMESYRSWIVVDKLRLCSGMRNFELSRKISFTGGYGWTNDLQYGASYKSMFSLKDIPGDLNEPLKLTGITVGLVNYFRYGLPFLKTKCNFSNVWDLRGKELSNKILRSKNIKISINEILPAKDGDGGTIILTVKSPMFSKVKMSISQQGKVFKIKSDPLEGLSGIIRWKDKFDFGKPAILHIEFNRSLRVGTWDLMLEPEK